MEIGGSGQSHGQPANAYVTVNAAPGQKNSKSSAQESKKLTQNFMKVPRGTAGLITQELQAIVLDRFYDSGLQQTNS